MGILKEYHIYRKKYTNVRRWKISPAARKERERIVLDFLDHIKGHVFAIKDIKRMNYDQYMYFLKNRRDLAPATRDRYRYALKEFFIAAELNIPVMTSPKQRHDQRIKKITLILGKSNIPVEYHGEIAEVIDGGLYGNSKK